MRLAAALLASLAAIATAACAGSTTGARDPTTIANPTRPPVASATATNTDLPASPTPSATATPAASPCAPRPPRAAGDTTASLSSGGLTRTYIVHVPPPYDGTRPVPLVLVFHGYALDAQYMVEYTQFDAVADAAGFITVYPNGAGTPQGWNTRDGPEQPNDLTFVRDLLAALESQLCIDPARVFAAGYSNGGGMVQRLACDMPEPFAAVGLVGAAYLPCPGQVPVVAFNGTADTFVPYEGVSSTDPAEAAPPVPTVIATWAAKLGCDPSPVISRPASDVQLSRFHGCPAGDSEAQLYTIIGGGHTWPGAAMIIDRLGTTSEQVHASLAMWAFFVAHPHR
ncbi:MAG TPA: PHB depolymerase family esterase [Dehalococcoidia bacterium]|nr:PHB depolymerase family esterase [Dehalococcoidia bacterium]